MEGLHSPLEAQGQPAALNPGAQHCHRRDVDLCYFTVITDGFIGGPKARSPFLKPNSAHAMEDAVICCADVCT